MKRNPKPDTLFSAVWETSRRMRLPVYLVGGPLRDLLLGRPCHDWDWVCRHAQKLAKAVSRRLQGKLITLDEQHKIYRIILKGEEGNRAITLDFAGQQGSIEKDLGRRDFTINAMALPLQGPEIGPWTDLIDPFGGRRDLKQKTIRAVSRQAFQEDPLRLLRAFRFSAQLGFVIDKQTLRWLRQHSRLITTVARERIREELLRLFQQPSAASAVAAMDTCKLLTAIFPDIEAGRHVALRYYGKGGVVKHALQAVANLESFLEAPQFIQDKEITEKVQAYIRHPVGGFPRAAFLKLGALLHDIGKPVTAQVIKGRLRFFGHEDAGADMARKLTEKLRFSRQECQIVRAWVQNHMRLGNLAATPKLTDKAMARFFRDLGEDGVGMLLVSLGDHYTYLPRAHWGKGKDPVERTARLLLERYYYQRDKVLPTPIINGHVLMKKFRLKSGPLIGRLLEAIRDAQAEGRIQTQEEAIGFIRLFLRRQQGKVES